MSHFMRGPLRQPCHRTKRYRKNRHRPSLKGDFLGERQYYARAVNGFVNVYNACRTDRNGRGTVVGHRELVCVVPEPTWIWICGRNRRTESERRPLRWSMHRNSHCASPAPADRRTWHRSIDRWWLLPPPTWNSSRWHHRPHRKTFCMI